jgi:hypothetical protein
MSTDKDGGPAFPQAESEYVEHVNHGRVRRADLGDAPAPGMSLRDWFAGQALAGFAAAMPAGNRVDLGMGQTNGDLWARAACALADAMLKALTSASATPARGDTDGR